MDIRNALSLAALFEMISTRKEGKQIAPELMANIDVSSLGLKAQKQAIYLTLGTRESLKEHARCPGVTQNSQLDRWVHFMPAICGDGELRCCIVIIRDESYQDCELVQVNTKENYSKRLYLNADIIK